MYKLVFILILSFFYSCVNRNSDEINSLYNKVMETHDEVMPKMDDIHNVKKQLGELLKNKKDSTEVFNVIKQLDDADEAMMVWMEEFNQDYKNLKIEEQKSYLESEYEKIKKVKIMMLESIDKGKQILEKNE